MTSKLNHIDTTHPQIKPDITLRQQVATSMKNYFQDLDGHESTDLYNLVLQEVEAPLLTSVMQYTKDNQSKAAEMLGLNRGTLRKKLKQYGLI